MSAIRLFNLNIWNYNEPWAARRDLIVGQIAAFAPDLVALQENRCREGAPDPRHQADQILDGLSGYTSIWRPAHYWPAEQGLEWEGLAILSKYPVVDQAVARLSRAPDDPRDTFQRLVLGARVLTPGGPFWLFNTHFPLSARARRRVSVESYHFIRETAGELPFAFTGDFNAQPEEDPIRYLTGQGAIGGLSGDFQDGWTACHPDAAGDTYPSWGPSRRIDYLFVPESVSVQRIEVVGTVPSQETVAPSDHCGLLADLEIGESG